MRRASNTANNLGARRRQLSIKNPVMKIVAISLLLVLVSAQPILSLVPLAFEDQWFPSGVGYFHDMQYGLGRVWTNQLIGQGRIVSINPNDMSDYTMLNITEGGIYSIAVDDVHNVVWGTIGGLYKIYANNTGYKRYSFPASVSGGGTQVTWDGKYVWVGISGSKAPAVLRFNPDTETWLVPNLVNTAGNPLFHVRDLVYDYVRNVIWAFSWSQVVKIDRETGNQLGVWSVPMPGEEFFSATFNGKYVFGAGPDDPDAAYVVRINPDNASDQVMWKLQNYFSLGNLYWPHTLISDADGMVYAGLYKSGYIIIINPETGPVDYISVGRWHLHGIAFDENGWLWGGFNTNPGVLHRYYLGESAPPPPPPPKQAIVTGYVTHANGTAIPNALVEIGEYSTHTDNNGFYNVTVPLSDYAVKVTIQDSFKEEKPYVLNVTYAGD